MKQIVLTIKEWKIDELWATANKEKGILKQISNIQFSSLQKLILWENHIPSIKRFSRIDLPQL